MLVIPLAQSFFQSFGALNAWNQIIRDKVSAAPITFGPTAFFGERARQRAFIKWHPRNHGLVHLFTRGKQIVLGILIEDVIDHLYRIDLSGPDGTHPVPGFPAVQTDADRVDELLAAQVVELVEPAIIAQPIIVPGVKLNQIEALQIGVSQAAVDILFDVIRRIGFVQSRLWPRWPLLIHRWDLRRGVEPLAAIGAHSLAEQLFAVAFPVSVCGVKEVAAMIDRSLQGLERLLII